MRRADLAGRRIAALCPVRRVRAAPCAAAPSLRGTGDLGVVIERAAGRVQVVDTTARASLGGDRAAWATCRTPRSSSRATARYAYVFGRDGGLTKVDLLRAADRRARDAGRQLDRRRDQPGRPRRRRAELHARRRQALRRGDARAPRRHSGDARARRQAVEGRRPGRRAGGALRREPVRRGRDLGDRRVAIRARRRSSASRDVGKQPYDGLVTPDGRWYLAGLFGEDGLALLDLWHPERGVRRILAGYGRGRGEAARLQDAAPARLGDRGRLRVPAGDRPSRGAGRRHARLAARSRACRSRASRCS